MKGIPPEISVLALSLGLLFALVCYLITNLSPGGMITPGWLALILIANPKLVLVVGAVVLLTYAAMLGIQRVVILYGKRLFASVVLVAVFLQVTAVVFVLKQFPQDFDETTLGFIVPGLIAYQLIRQPVGATLISTASVTVLAYVIFLVGVKLRFITSEGQGLAAERLELSTPSTPVVLALVVLVAAGFVYLGLSLRRVERTQ